MPQHTDGTARILRRIAAALGVPVEALFAEEDGHHPTAEEFDTLVRAYRSIRDPALRRRCLDQVVVAAGGPAAVNTDPGGS